MKIKGKTEVTSSLKTSKKEQAAKLLNVKEEQKKPKKSFSKREKILFVVIFVLLLVLLLIGCPWIRRGINQLFHPDSEIVEKVTDKKKNTDKKSDSKKTDKSDKKKGDQVSNSDSKNTTKQTGSAIGTGSNSNQSSSNNSNGSGSNENGGGNSEITPTPIPVTPIASFQLVSWEQASVSMYQPSGSTTITFTGSLSAKSPLPSQGIHTGYYIQFMVVAPQNYSSNILDNMHIVTATNEYNKHIDGYVNGLPFFYITQEVRPGMVIPLSMNWGDGQTVNYTLSFQLELN